MNLPPAKLLSKEERKLVILKAQEAREKIFKLVVKIISWQTRSMDSIAIKHADKVTNHEWIRYKQHLLNISKSESTERVRDKLTQTYNAIKEHGGFK